MIETEETEVKVLKVVATSEAAEPDVEDSAVEALLNDALAQALKAVSPTDRQAYVARLNKLKESLAKKISVEKAKLRPQDNTHLEGMTSNQIIALLPPMLRASVYVGDTLVATIPLEFVTSKSGDVGSVGSASASLRAADGTNVDAKIRAGVVIPVKSKKEKPPSKKKKVKA